MSVGGTGQPADTQALKTCSRCAEVKDLSEFHASKWASDGKRWHCKECDKAARRLWEHNNREIVNARRKRWRARGGEALVQRMQANYREANKEKRSASRKVRTAIANGTLVRPERCSECGRECYPHGHHEDYSQPLVVVWLCVWCHKKRHAELNAVAR